MTVEAARRLAARIGSVAAAALVVVACAAHAGTQAIERYISYLESPRRARWQEPEAVVQALGVRSGQRITDLGAGTGYFSRRLARAVGPNGRVDAADVDPELLADLEKRARAEGLSNVLPRRVRANDPQLPAHSADLVFLCNSYHHLPDRIAYLQKLLPGIAPDGRVVVVDFYKRPDIVEGPAFEEKVARETVVEEFHRAGFSLDREESFLPLQYFLFFRPTAAYSFGPLVRAVAGVMRSGAPSRQKQRQVAALLAKYLRQRGLEDRFQLADPARPVTTYLLYTDPAGRFSLAALVFRSHARTTVHDHQSWVVWGTYSGQERETRYLRRDAPGREFPRLSPRWSKVFAAGEISFIEPPPGDIHDVENVTNEVSVSVHLHATDIGKQVRNSYDLKRGIVRPFVQSYERAM
jgi:predicted metal-dependent enzyme (double-stranded beta helix superfamily)/ubiquinone/menaquinone biosynthesis C-methylase UbiE